MSLHTFAPTAPATDDDDDDEAEEEEEEEEEDVAEAAADRIALLYAAIVCATASPYDPKSNRPLALANSSSPSTSASGSRGGRSNCSNTQPRAHTSTALPREGMLNKSFKQDAATVAEAELAEEEEEEEGKEEEGEWEEACCWPEMARKSSGAMLKGSEVTTGKT